MSKLKKSVLSALLMIMLGCVLVNASEYVVLTQDNPNATISSKESVIIYGTSDANQITVESTADVKLVNFPGSNTVSIESDSGGFTVSRSGAVVIFEGEDGTRLKIPASQTVQLINFNDLASLTLKIYDGQVMLDDQVVTTTAASIDGSSEVTSECGAYVAPGVWKEFDCYNLAAIGKTTGDDPFTPSWRLIGGYWKWGRKGPDESEWYDTNTSHFAHGPTGPELADANKDIISWWDTTYAPDGSWSDGSKTANDPCPEGYRVPTTSQWDGVDRNNTQSIVGTWSKSETNYSSAMYFGDNLMLPAAGNRNFFDGHLSRRGYYGSYWSSTDIAWEDAYRLTFSSDISNSIYCNTYATHRYYGFSVRCIAE